MENVVRLRFLGTVQVERDGEPVRDLGSRKALALLGYLAVQGQPVPRERLADLFWGDKSEARGRANLSWVLSRISAFLPGCLLADRHTVQFQRAAPSAGASTERSLERSRRRLGEGSGQAPYWLDIVAFEELEARGDVASLVAAAELYRGEFLEGLYLDGCAEFEIWLVGERERWRQRVAWVLGELVAHHSRYGEYEQGQRFARRLLALEPWREATHRQVMRLLAWNGQRGAALAQYEACRHCLAEELGVEPAEETTALYEQIRDGEYQSVEVWKTPAHPHPHTPTPPYPHTLPPPPIGREALSPFVVGPPITAPRQFFGRERELKRIFGLWRRFPLQHVAVIGPKRSGKSSLLHYLKNITRAAPAELRPGQRTDWLPQPERYRWVLVDFQDARMGHRDRLLRHLLAGLSMPAPSPCNLDTFMDIASRYLRTPAVILMDEIGAGLASPELDEPFWWSLRSLVSHCTGGNLACLLTSHAPPARLAQDHGKPSPFFNIFHTLELGPFTDAEARELIASSPRPFGPADVAWILDQSGRWPCLLQILCQICLTGLEEGQTGDGWREEGLRQIAPFRYLLLLGNE